MEGQTNSLITQKIGFIGGGNMARAIFDGIISKKLVNANKIFVYGPHVDRLTHFKEKGANIAETTHHVLISCDIIFICVKPHILNIVVGEMHHDSVDRLENKIFISVLAATTINKIEKYFTKPIKLIRVMPNTPLAVGEGCCLFSPNELVDEKDINLTRTLLESSGLCLQVPETQINAMASISGSGPAFMYTIIEAMADGGVKMGVPRSEAIKLAAQTMLGAAKMVLQSGKHSAQLKDEVCSAGGTTIAGVHALEKGGIRGVIMDAVEATTKRSLEMGK